MTSVLQSQHEHYAEVRHGLKAVRLSRLDLSDARSLQRKGRTMREISETMGVPLREVQQSLYWDEVAK